MIKLLTTFIALSHLTIFCAPCWVLNFKEISKRTDMDVKSLKYILNIVIDVHPELKDLASALQFHKYQKILPKDFEPKENIKVNNSLIPQ